MPSKQSLIHSKNTKILRCSFLHAKQHFVSAVTATASELTRTLDFSCRETASISETSCLIALLTIHARVIIQAKVNCDTMKGRSTHNSHWIRYCKAVSLMGTGARTLVLNNFLSQWTNQYVQSVQLYNIYDNDKSSAIPDEKNLAFDLRSSFSSLE